MRPSFKALILAASLFVACSPSMARAQDATVLGTFGDWTAYTYREGDQPVCYMSAKPFKDEGKYAKRGPIFALITHRPGEKTKNTFSYVTGYGYKQGSPVTVSIDGKQFNLFTHGETAWAPDQGTDDSLAAALQKGSQMVVKGTSGRGNLTTDSFSLKGSGDAYAAISKECGV